MVLRRARRARPPAAVRRSVDRMPEHQVLEADIVRADRSGEVRLHALALTNIIGGMGWGGVEWLLQSLVDAVSYGPISNPLIRSIGLNPQLELTASSTS